MKNILLFTEQQNGLHFNVLNTEDYEIIIFDTKKETLRNLAQKNYENSIIVADDINFLQILFRLYNQSFDSFIYIANEKNSLKSFDEFDIFLTNPISKSENIAKNIYVLGKVPRLSLSINLKKINSFNEVKIEKSFSKIQKVFYFKNRFFMSEFVSFNYEIITLDSSVRKESSDLSEFFFNLDNYLLKYMENILILFDNSNKNIEALMKEYKIILDDLSQRDQEKFIVYFKFIINNLSNENIKNYLNSFLANLEFFTSKMFDSLIEHISSNNLLTLENKYFLFWQYTRINFTKSLDKQVSQEIFWAFYKNIYTEYKKVFEKIEFIPKEKRNKNLIFLFTSQFLGEAHAPTKNFLDVAYNLIKNFNKEVLIINTIEGLTNRGAIPFYNQIIANKVTQYTNTNQIPYKGINIPFYQCSNDMPNNNDILNILLIVQEYKPYFILSLSTILTADLASNLITTATFPTSSNLTISQSQIHIKAGETNEKEKELLKFLNIDSESIINVQGWRKDENLSKVNYKRTDFNLPDDKFLLVIVGNRLNDEITEDFISMLIDTISENTYIVFIGFFSNYENYCSKFNALKENSSYLGYQENLYDVLKLFDLFVNPSRLGGGTGGFLSLMNALPIVTLDYGDVYSNAKNNFGVKSYEDMREIIIRHSLDNLYHQEQSKLAYKIYNDSSTIKETIKLMLDDLEKNIYFK